MAKVQAGKDQVVAVQEMAAAAVGSCPNPRAHYLTEVNKGSIRMQTWASHLNDLYQQGYRLAHTFEQDGNTVQVYEHHHA